MSNDKKAQKALAMIAALQTILDKLPDGAETEGGADQNSLEEEPDVKNPTHQLFVGPLDQHSLAGLFTSIRIIHNIHSVSK